MSSVRPILGYWTIRGLCNPIRYLLAYLNVDHEHKLYQHPMSEPPTEEDWFKIKNTLGIEFPNIPYWIDGDIKMSESQAILKHIARRYDNTQSLIPTDHEITRQADLIEGVCYDAMHSMLWFCYFFNGAELDMYLERHQAIIESLSKFLGQKKWITGETISYVDFWVYETLYMHSKYNAAWVETHENLVNLMKRFETLEPIARYIASPNYVRVPCNSPKAKHPFGQV